MGQARAPVTQRFEYNPHNPMQAAALRCLAQLSRERSLALRVAREPAVHALLATAASCARFPPPGSSHVCERAADVGEDGEERKPLHMPVSVAGAAAVLLQSLLPIALDPHEDSGDANTDAVAAASPQADAAEGAALADAPPPLPPLLLAPPSAEVCAVALRGLARCVASSCATSAQCAVAAASLLLPDHLLLASPRPPLVSPPGTPPPPPLPTSQYVWDALGRPAMTDGSNVKLVHI